jgi:AcrR family transcriptional regulator
MLYNIEYIAKPSIKGGIMPPAVNFTPDCILNEAFEIARKEGFQSVTARKIAQNLGCSTQPVYSAFGSMQKLQEAVLQKAKAYALTYLLHGRQGADPFLEIGMQYFRFSQADPALFQGLFLEGKLDMTLEKVGMIFAPLLERMKEGEYLQSLRDAQLQRIGRDMWVYTHGLIALMHNAGMPDAEGFVRSQLYQMGRTIIEWEYAQQPDENWTE